MKRNIQSPKGKPLSLRDKITSISLTHWGLIVAILTGIITLVAWLWPEPIKPNPNTMPTPTSFAQSFGIGTIPTREPNKVRIIVAKFDEVSQSSYRVTDLILAKLRDAISDYPDSEVIFLDRVITEKEGSDLAIKIGELHNASIVIWGWYGLTDKAVPLGVHFDIIPSSETFRPGTCAASSSQIGKADPSKLSDLTLQTNLSNELTYLTIFTLGLARFEANDWNEALLLFNDAIEHFDPTAALSATTSENAMLLNMDLLYDYRASTNFELGNYDIALADFEKISQSKAGEPVYQIDLAKVYNKQGDYESALEHLGMVVNGNYSSRITAKALYLRGTIYDTIGMQTQANHDFQNAIETNEDAALDFAFTEFVDYSDTSYNYLLGRNPNNFLAYYFRAIYYEDKNFEKSLSDYNKALELLPEFPAAREGRIDLIIRLQEPYDYDYIIKEFETLFNYPEYRTPCNLNNLGGVNREAGFGEVANNYFTEAVSIATEEIEADPNNAYAYYVRGLAFENLDQKESALQDYQKFIGLDPELADEYGIAAYINDLTNPNVLVVVLYLSVAAALILGFYQLVLFLIRSHLRPKHRRHKK